MLHMQVLSSVGDILGMRPLFLMFNFCSRIFFKKFKTTHRTFCALFHIVKGF